MVVNVSNRNGKYFHPIAQENVEFMEGWDHYAPPSGDFTHQWESYMHIGLVY
jgi:hypothetical protein